MDTKYNNVTKPKHYTEGRKYEPKDVIHDWKLSWNLGNAVKYISRAGRKGDAEEDLLKAIEYIKYEIGELHKDEKPIGISECNLSSSVYGCKKRGTILIY